MAKFSGPTWGKAKKYTDNQIAIFLTSGATPMGSWDASTNTPTLTDGVGSTGQYYDVVVAGTSLGQTFLVGDRVMYNSSNKWQRVPTGVESETPMVVAYVSEATVHLPSTRPSGRPLKNGDYVQVLSTATLPFTIDGITFDSFSDMAEWNGTTWQEKSYTAGQTNEVAVKNSSLESLSGTATYQNVINQENKDAIQKRIPQLSTMTTPSASDLGKVVQYIGATTTTGAIYEHNHFYECVADGTFYKWQETSVQDECKYDNATIGKNASNELYVKDNGVDTAQIKNGATTFAKINSEAVCPDILDDPVNDKLPTAQAVYKFAKTDGTTLDHDAENGIHIKDGGVGYTQIDSSIISSEIPAEDPSTTKITNEASVYNLGEKKLNKLYNASKANVELKVKTDASGNVQFYEPPTPPSITAFTASPDSIPYGTSTQVTLSVTASQGTKALSKATITYNGTSVDITPLTSGTPATTTVTISTATAFSCVVYDVDNNPSETSYFMVTENAPTYTAYFGTVNNGVQAVTGQAGKAYTSPEVTLVNDGFKYKYPKSLGALTSAVANGDDVLSLFTRTEETISDVVYYVYSQSASYNGAYTITFG